MGKKLAPVFSFSFEMPVWRMLADDTSKWLVIELRDAEAHELQYQVIDLEHIKLFKQELLIEEGWWTGLTALQGDKLVLHKFQDSENPEKKSFYVLDIPSGKICWQSEVFIFLGINKNEILGYEKPERNERIYKMISLEDHAEKMLGQEEINRKISELAEAQKRNKAITYPFYYPEDHAYFATVEAFLTRFLHIHPVKGCEYLEQKGAIIISYYIYEEKAMTNYLLVINQAQEVLLHEKIGSRLSGIGADTFFVVENRLIFIKEQHQLNGYALDNVQ